MSDLLNQASLVMVPSGYKEDTVYSVVPSDGSGDLAFTRASNGTRVNSAGLVEVVPWNILVSSQSFTTSGGDWNYTAGSGVTTGQTGYDGTTNAVLFTDSGANGDYGAYQSISQLGSQTFSIYAKAGSVSSFAIDIYQTPTPRVIVNLSNGTITSGSGVIESVGNGWYRISVTAVMTTTYYVRFGCTVAGNVYIQNAQLNIGSTANPYFPTTDRLNVPRLTYQNGGGGCPSLLLEKQSTNLCLYSEQFDNAAYNKISGGSATVPVVTANFATSPDGSQNADRIQFARTGTTASDFSAINQSSLTLSATGTTTIYLKSNTSSNQNVLMYWGGGQGQVFLVTPSWQRFTLSNLSVGTDAIVFGTRGGTGNFFNGGDLTLDILAWGAQLEQSSYPTSYIPTTSSSATRVADACFKTSATALIGQTEGTMFGEIEVILGTTNMLGWIRKLSGGIYSDTILTYVSSTGLPSAGVSVGGVDQVAINGTTSLSAGYHKIAFAYKANDFVLYVNGVQVASDTSGSVPTCDELYIDQYIDGGLRNATKKEFVLFKTRLTNAELAQLTA